MIAVGVLLAGPDGTARLEALPADLHTAADEAIASGGPDSAVALHGPDTDPDVLTRGLALLLETGCAAVVAAAPQTDTLKLATPTGLIERTIERSLAYDLRAPQIYRAGALRAALARADPDAVAEAIRQGDHTVLPGLVEGTVRVVAVSPRASGPAAPRRAPDPPDR